MDNKPYDVSLEQLAHDFTMLKVQRQIDNGKITTYGDMYDLYVDELDTVKTFLSRGTN
ncbi:hypothetical protein [Clostridium sp. UBA7339]|uniref:hypothetical protein n=1 Tax=Clostridium sp. UBA7339 TaxID=1946376 RepID=UPI0032164DDF